jgi:hypothetical protein
MFNREEVLVLTRSSKPLNQSLRGGGGGECFSSMVNFCMAFLVARNFHVVSFPSSLPNSAKTASQTTLNLLRWKRCMTRNSRPHYSAFLNFILDRPLSPLPALFHQAAQTSSVLIDAM